LKALIGLGCSFIAGIEAGGHDGSFLKHVGDAIEADTYNFGAEAQGNLGSVLQLTLSDVDWSKYDDIHIIFMPTGLNRIDVINKDFNPGRPFLPVFPCISSPGSIPEVYGLEVEYGKYWTPECQAVNFVIACKILNLHVDKLKARLTLFPAFSRDYNQELFGELLKNNTLNSCIPWKNFVYLNNSTNFWDWTVSLSGSSLKSSMMEYHNKEKDKQLEGWIEERFHPSAKAHKILADRILKMLYG